MDLLSHPGGVKILLVASYYRNPISAGSDEPSDSPNYDWGRLYLLPYLQKFTKMRLSLLVHWS